MLEHFCLILLLHRDNEMGAHLGCEWGQPIMSIGWLMAMATNLIGWGWETDPRELGGDGRQILSSNHTLL